MTARETLIAGAIAYWCEGAKSKPYRRSDRISFINTDSRMIRFFLRFLDTAGVEADQVYFRVHIHESADVQAAEAFWLRVTEANPARFHRTLLKRHNPKTVRKNVGDNYHGCLRIDVHRGANLYQRIEGWCLAAMNEPAETSDD